VSTNPWAEALWLALGFGLLLYALTGGADLGAGLWSLLARGPRREAQRQAVSHAIAPIWEANHVWLIFVIVVLFSAFPRAFAVLGIAFHIPIALSLLGIVMRGAAFSFHAYGIQSDATKERWERLFAWSSSVTPVFLGLVVGGLSSGKVRVSDGIVTSGWFAGWTTPFAVLVGLFALALFALLSACYLAADTDGDLSDDFRRRAIAAELVAGVLAFAVFLVARREAPALFDELASSPWTWPVQGVTAALALSTIYFAVRRRARLARYSAALQVAMVVIGWGLAMDHHFVRPDVTIDTAGSRPEVLPSLVVALGVGALVLVPALYYLYRVFKLEPHR
jgi:cytochrome bd ubiquinol oxidase subunit II